MPDYYYYYYYYRHYFSHLSALLWQIYFSTAHLSFSCVLVVGELHFLKVDLIVEPMFTHCRRVGMHVREEVVDMALSLAGHYPARIDELVALVVCRVAAESHGVLLVHLQSADTCTESWEHSPAENNISRHFVLQ